MGLFSWSSSPSHDLDALQVMTIGFVTLLKARTGVTDIVCLIS